MTEASNSLRGVFRKDNYVHGAVVNQEVGKHGIGCFIYEKMVQNNDKIFQINGITGETETYDSTLKRSTRVALEMLVRGVSMEDVVLLCSENTLDAFIPFCATQFLNAKLASIDPSQSRREITYLLNLSKPKIAFIQKESVQLVSDALDATGLDMEIVCMGDKDHPNSLENFLQPKAGEDDYRPEPLKDYNHPTFILFSSGTTGMPKGILCSGHAMLNNVLSVRLSGVSAEVGTHLATYYWMTAILVTLMILLDNGIKVVIPSRNIDIFMKAICDHKVTMALNAYTFGIGLTEKEVAGMDFSHLRHLQFGGSKIPDEHLIKCRKLLPKAHVTSVYGQTEAPGYITTFNYANYDLALTKTSSCGQPIPGIIMKIVNPDTEELLNINQQGEVRYKSKFPFRGYYQANSSDVFDKDGFIKTGDLGYFDKDNCLYICDRLKDTFKYQSWHVAPAAIEDIIYKHPAVKEAIVIGVPHSEDGAHPLAVVITKDTFKRTTEHDIANFVNSRVSDREKLRGGVKFVKEFLKTPSGKILRRQIKEIVLQK